MKLLPDTLMYFETKMLHVYDGNKMKNLEINQVQPTVAHRFFNSTDVALV